MRNKVANLDSEIERYRQEVGLVQDVDVNVHAQRLGQINNLLIQAEVDAAVAQDRLTRIQRARGGNLSADSEIIASPLIQTLRTQEAELQRKQSELLSDFGPKHPQVLSNQASLAGLRAKIDGEIARMQQARESDVAGARQRVQMLKSQVSGLEQEQGAAIWRRSSCANWWWKAMRNARCTRPSCAASRKSVSSSTFSSLTLR